MLACSTLAKTSPGAGGLTPGDKLNIRPVQGADAGRPERHKGMLNIYELCRFILVNGVPGIFKRLDFEFRIFLGKAVMFFQLA